MNTEKMRTEAIETGPALQTPRFDESAAAGAQPVEPLPKSGLARWIQNMRAGMFNRSTALVLVIVAGLAIGALGGMWWGRESLLRDASRPLNESVSELPKSAVQNEEPNAPMSGVAAWQSSVSNTTRSRRTRSRAQTGSAPRAYRVAVIR
jgi:type IV secretory pathway VirB2 component (pilin)